jgi:hydrophobe/amphiphile efflux-1 (HAE1) family protein
MLNLSRPFLQRPKATALLVAGFFALGVGAYFQLPISALPDVDFPTINVNASLPGASAETMASSVASPLERAFANIPYVTSMSSSSSLGQAQIVVQFQLDRDIDAASQDIQAAISAAAGQLPKDMPNPPSYKKANPNGFSIMSLSVYSNTLPLSEVYDYADNVIARAIARLPGVGQVDYHGDQVPAIRVQINPRALAARNLDLEDVRTALGAATANNPKGSVDGSQKTLLIQSNDQLLKAADYNSQILAWRGGSPTRVADVGSARDSVLDLKSAGWVGARRAIIVDVHKQTGAKVDVPALIDTIKAMLPELEKGLPPAIKVGVVMDRTQNIRAGIVDVQLTLAITIGLVALVIFLFLRDSMATLISGISIPLSLIGTFPLMYLLGFSLDNISLMGLTIAVGFVVDDAIVVLENIMRHLEMGKPRFQAALDGAGEVGFTVLSMTLSLIGVFLPLLLMTGIVGRVFREFAITVSIALILSAIISLSQTAVSCSLFLRPPAEHGRGRFYRAIERLFNRLLAVYRAGLLRTLDHQRAGLLLTLGLLAASFGLFIVIPKGFIPEQDNGIIFASTEASPDIPFAEMCAKNSAIARIIAEDPNVDHTYAFVESRPATNLGRVTIVLKPSDQRKSTAVQVMARLRPKVKAVPGMKVYLKAVQDITIGTGGSKTLYQFVLQDTDINELYDAALLYQRKLQTLPELQDVGSDLSALAPAVAVVIDRDKAASYGISAVAIDQILYDAFGQRQVATLYTQLNQYKVILEVSPEWHLDATSLQALQVRSPKSGQQIPLSSFTRLEPGLAPLTVGHLGAFPAVTLSFNVASGKSLGDAVAAIQRAEAQLHKSGGLRTSFQGSAQAFQDSLSSQPLLILAAIAVVYIILGVLYESFAHPITILSSLPSATFGALLAMWLFRIDLSVITLIGLILLVGIVKKNAIMMVDVALKLQREEGRSARDAIFEACLLRFRPIMMTTMAALLGAIPLAVGTGAGSELRQPLGIAIVGGLLVSQFVTLYTVPIIFLYVDRATQWLGRKRRPAPLPAAAVPVLD